MPFECTESERARIWARVGPPDENGCRDCTGQRNHAGYGMINFRKSPRRLHRLVFLLSGGLLTPEQPLVCHRCNRPTCCEPTHLYADNQAGNLRYMAEQGRSGAHVHPERLARGDSNGARVHAEQLPRGDQHYARTHPERLARGEGHGQSRLTPQLVAYARARYAAGGVSQRQLARELGVSQPAISKVIRGVHWKDVD